ncbi:MAG: polyprenyl synthetase family protein [Albidovulum sp.]|nr:polyprenyl synthetase family protein [Albidovulum sp.]
MLGDSVEHELVDAMRYAVAGGKRIRGFLVMESSRLHGVPVNQAVRAATAVECLHAYSLVHDDLPCMDNDDLRRGRLTVHKKWNESLAVLTGDALQALAYQILAEPETSPHPEVRAELVRTLATAAGASGMTLGQAMDIAAETASARPSREEIELLQSRKTGALLCWSAQAGPRLAGEDSTSLLNYAHALGLAYQIADDIVDAEGDPALAGKRLRKDADAGKATLVSLLGLEKAKQTGRVLVDQARDALEQYGERAETLRAVAEFAIDRRR